MHLNQRQLELIINFLDICNIRFVGIKSFDHTEIEKIKQELSESSTSNTRYITDFHEEYGLLDKIERPLYMELYDAFGCPFHVDGVGCTNKMNKGDSCIEIDSIFNALLYHRNQEYAGDSVSVDRSCPLPKEKKERYWD